MITKCSRNESVPVGARLPLSPKHKPIEAQAEFLQRIVHECRRAERSKQRFLLVLIDGFAGSHADMLIFAAAISSATRATDSLGWYRQDATLGILFTELGKEIQESSIQNVVQKVRGAFEQAGSAARFSWSAHLLPRDLNEPVTLQDPEHIYECIEPSSMRHSNLRLGIKRTVDLVGAILLLIMLAPLLAVIACAIKLESEGPVLFRQTRVGRRGRHFTFLKFRSMAATCNQSLHEDYVKAFIRGTAAKHPNEKGEGVFKLTQDPRVTRVGRFLRKTSLDEFPQLWNVVRGEMSLVGPRPPIPYEVECYDLWHQRRVLDVTPGITGLWQISGRSRTGFDEMVRLDLQYVRTWSPWLDLKILLQTPLAVVKTDGAH